MRTVIPGEPLNRDRRHTLRALSQVPLDLYDLKGRMVVGEGKFINLSETGALVESPKPLKKRATVRLHVMSGKSAALQVAGRVIWARRLRRGFAYGIQFLRSTPPAPALC